MVQLEPYVFISYRRDDTKGVARHLCDLIEGQFGPGSAFLDVEDLDGGDAFGARIPNELHRATVVLILIGPAWLGAEDKTGKRRLDNPDDWVRRELLLAFDRPDRPIVIPTLIYGARMPRPEELDALLRPLCAFQAFHLREETWRDDAARLIDRLAAVGFRIRGPHPNRRLDRGLVAPFELGDLQIGPPPAVTAGHELAEIRTQMLAATDAWTLLTLLRYPLSACAAA